MRKKLLSIFLLLLMVTAAFAVNIEEVLQDAKSNSSVYQGYEISLQNALINQQQSDLNGVVWSINGGYDYSEDSSVITPSSVSITVPDLYDGLKLTFATSLGQLSTTSKGPVTITPSISVSKDFDIKSFMDTREDLEDLKTVLQTEINYKTNVYNFENNLLNAIVSIMQAESKLKSSEVSYNRAMTSYLNDKKLGSIEEGSLTDIEQKMRLESSRASLDSLKVSYEKALKDFRQQFGIEYSPITEVRDADLSFDCNEIGNSTVLISMYNLEIAQQDLEETVGKADTLSFAGFASKGVKFNSEEKYSALNVTASVKYTSDTWELSSHISDSFGENQSMIPSISLTGKWSSSSTKSESNSLTIQKMRNNVLEKENAYNTALYSYSTNLQSLEKDISNHKNDVEQLKIQTDYHKAILDYQNKLYDLGLSTEQNVEDAKTNYENDLAQAIILKLQAVVLENKIKTIEL